MWLKLPLIVPIRLLAALSHIIITSIILMYREWNLYGCEGSNVRNDNQLYKIKDDQYIIALSFIIGITGIELLSFMSGLSIYSNLQSFVSTAFHISGFIATLFFMFYRSCTDLIWVIFGVCTFIPFFTEIVTAVRICACKRLPAW